ncbi:MAG: class I tRNA ligase family protein, partial [Sphingomicrobium sp.]
VAFEIVESPIPELVGAHAVVWTTTPWTIPVNQAIAIGPKTEYIVLEDPFSSRRYVVANEPDLLAQFIGRVSGDGFANWAALARAAETSDVAKNWLFETTDQPLKVWAADLQHAIARHPMHHLGGFFAKPRPFLAGDFVTTDTGTGLVHMSPDHGEDDFDLCKANGIDPVFAVEGDGKYREDWAWLGGQGSVINAKFNAPDGPICSDLRDAGALLAASADYRHSYPHSWRSKAKVIYRCTPQWFIAMDRPLSAEHSKSFATMRWENEGGAVKPSPLEGEGDSPEASGVRGRTQIHSTADAAGPSPVSSPSRGEEATLRQLALAAITDTRWVPEKGENRIRSMVEGRPDWVISRQRAWGVPIALFVKRGTNQPLIDHEVNARIVAAIKAHGVDAWSDNHAQDYLGSEYDAADYERVTDILDVWFDSGCTHVFVLESGRWPELRWPADLYLEGSDQHRGWFQSSLMESCGTRGRAPYRPAPAPGPAPELRNADARTEDDDRDEDDEDDDDEIEEAAPE